MKYYRSSGLLLLLLVAVAALLLVAERSPRVCDGRVLARHFNADRAGFEVRGLDGRPCYVLATEPASDARRRRWRRAAVLAAWGTRNESVDGTPVLHARRVWVLATERADTPTGGGDTDPSGGAGWGSSPRVRMVTVAAAVVLLSFVFSRGALRYASAAALACALLTAGTALVVPLSASADPARFWLAGFLATVAAVLGFLFGLIDRHSPYVPHAVRTALALSFLAAGFVAGGQAGLFDGRQLMRADPLAATFCLGLLALAAYRVAGRPAPLAAALAAAAWGRVVFIRWPALAPAAVIPATLALALCAALVFRFLLPDEVQAAVHAFVEPLLLATGTVFLTAWVLAHGRPPVWHDIPAFADLRGFGPALLVLPLVLPLALRFFWASGRPLPDGVVR